MQRILKQTTDKIVVVSEWATFLTIMAKYLDRDHIEYVKFVGGTPISKRNDIIAQFNNESMPRVSLQS